MGIESNVKRELASKIVKSPKQKKAKKSLANNKSIISGVVKKSAM